MPRKPTKLSSDEIRKIFSEADDENFDDRDSSQSSSDGEQDRLSVNEFSDIDDTDSEGEIEVLLSDVGEIESDNSDASQEDITVMVSKNGLEAWHNTPQQNNAGRAASRNVMHAAPGPTRHAIRCVVSIDTAFDLFFTNSM